jgi:hypothetical protein
LAVLLPISTVASLSANLIWNTSTNPAVTGYNIYFGGASQQYTNSIAVGNATNAVISGLHENTPYFFAAKAHDGNGNESAFSNEAAFAGLTTPADYSLQMETMPTNSTGSPLLFSLDASAPAGATINPTNGVLCWTPGRTHAFTTNYITVMVTSTANPAWSLPETLVITVGGCLEFQLGTTVVSAGQPSSLPLTVAAGSSVTNVQMTFAWPGASLINPTLTFAPPIIAGSLVYQNNQIVIQLQAAAEQPLTGTNQVALLNFQAFPGQPSSIISIPATAATSTTLDGFTLSNVMTQSGEVVVVGSNPLLRPQADVTHGRTLTLFANPGNYQLQSATSLATPMIWTPMLTYQQTNVAQTVFLDSAEPVIFYRLQQF